MTMDPYSASDIDPDFEYSSVDEYISETFDLPALQHQRLDDDAIRQALDSFFGPYPFKRHEASTATVEKSNPASTREDQLQTPPIGTEEIKPLNPTAEVTTLEPSTCKDQLETPKVGEEEIQPLKGPPDVALDFGEFQPVRAIDFKDALAINYSELLTSWTLDTPARDVEITEVPKSAPVNPPIITISSPSNQVSVIKYATASGIILPGFAVAIPGVKTSHPGASLEVTEIMKWSSTDDVKPQLQCYGLDLTEFTMADDDDMTFHASSPVYQPENENVDPSLEQLIMAALGPNTAEKVYIPADLNEIPTIAGPLPDGYTLIELNTTGCLTEPVANVRISELGTERLSVIVANTNNTEAKSARQSTSKSGTGKKKRAKATELESKPRKERKRKAVPEEEKDEAYWARRAKNTASTRRSREAKRAEINQAISKVRALEAENAKMAEMIKEKKLENVTMKQQLLELTQGCSRDYKPFLHY